MAGGYDLVDESRPIVRPFLLQDGNEDEVQLVQEDSLGPQRLFRSGTLYDETNDEISNAWNKSVWRSSSRTVTESIYLGTALWAEPSTLS